MRISTFKDDLLGLESFANQLNGFIKVEQNFVNDGLVIALSSKFGSGKTSFLNMWSNSLAELEKEQRPTVVYLNAWESDYLGDPLFSIISSLAQTFKKDGKQDLRIRSSKLPKASLGLGLQSAIK